MDAGRLYRPLGLLALSLIGLALIWQIITAGMAVRNRADAPQAAAHWRADDAKAWTSWSEMALMSFHRDDAAVYARRAIALSPIDARSYRTMGQALVQKGEVATAEKLFAYGAMLSRREPAISYWLYRDALLSGRFGVAFFHADALMRRSPRTASIILPEIVGTLADSRAVAAIVERLGYNPRWRPAFAHELADYAPPTVALEVLRELSDAKTPTSNAEVSMLLRRMSASGDYEQAYAVWLTFLPSEARPAGRGVYDGTFQRPEGPEPFGWRFTHSGESEASTTPGGLEVRQAGFDRARVARQYLVLPAGRYRLTSRAAIIDGTEARLAWRLVCRGGRPLGNAPFAFTGDSGVATAEFDVALGCGMQELTLNVVDGDLRSSATVRVEQVDIQPLGATP